MRCQSKLENGDFSRTRGVFSGRKSALTRQFHASNPQPMWFVVAGLSCAGVFIGTRYILRAQERIRRKGEGLPLDDDDDHNLSSSSSRKRLDRVLGLDFGTSNLRMSGVSLLPSSSTPSIRVLESAEGYRAIPSAVSVDNGHVTVGALAKSLLGRKLGATALGSQLLLGRSSMESEIKGLLEQIRKDSVIVNDELAFSLDNEQYTAEWTSEVLLDHMRTIAMRSYADTHDEDAEFATVLTTPAGSSSERRDALVRVASSAGFDVVSVVEEPVAALHAAESCTSESLTSSSPIAVFDMGGYESTISIVSRCQREGSYTVIRSLTTSKLSGRVLDALLYEQVTQKFQDLHGIDLRVDHMAKYRVLEAVESAKMELSTRNSTDINLPFITANQTGAKHLVQRVSTVDLQRLSEKPMKHALQLCEEAVQAAEKPGVLLLIGGGARSPVIQQPLEQFFGLQRFKAKEFQPEEAVVRGAAEVGRRLLQK